MVSWVSEVTHHPSQLRTVSMYQHQQDIDADSYIIVPDCSTRSTVVEGTCITDNYTKMFTDFLTSSMYATEQPADASTATFFKISNSYAPTPAINGLNAAMCCMNPASIDNRSLMKFSNVNVIISLLK